MFEGIRFTNVMSDYSISNSTMASLTPEELEKAKGRADPDILAQPDFADGASRGQRHGKSIHGQGHSQQKNSKK